MNLCAVVTMCASVTLISPAPGKAADAGRVANANNAFAVDCYKQIASGRQNLVFSPYSISAAFGMTYAGAAGATAEQMRKTMHWDCPAADAARDFNALNKELLDAQQEGVKLSIANSLWPQRQFPFRPEFTELLKTEFQGAFFPADFTRNPEAERARINQWISDRTETRIKDVIPAGGLTPLTRLVLCNAIYFKGNWDLQFFENATTTATFALTSGEKVDCKLMAREAYFRFAEKPGLKILAMPYAGRKLSMLIALPDQPAGLNELEKQLSAETISSWVRDLKPQNVRVQFPKFTANYGLELSSAMQHLGMVDAFVSGKADFSGMNGQTNDLFISRAFHKAFLEVNEQGTEAAAATALAVNSRAAPVVKVPVFRADHPFLYFIRDNPTGAILFMGRLMDPTK